MSHTSYLFLLFCTLYTLAKGCEPYSGKYCSSLINYDVHLIGGRSQVLTESLTSLLTDIIAIPARTVDPDCATAAVEYGCGSAFPQCTRTVDGNQTVTTIRRVCKETCLRFVEKCGSLINKVDPTQLPNCDSIISGDTVLYPTENCVELHSVFLTDQEKAEFKCPDPFILNPYPDVPNENCFGLCCVPCPQGDYFYKKSQQGIYDPIVGAFGFISMICCIYVCITYALMPDKRRYPSSLIFFISFSLLIFYLTLMFNIADSKKVRCINEVQIAAPGMKVPVMCTVQSIFTTYGVLSAILWYFLLMLNVFVNVVFLSKRMKDYRYYYPFICFGLPLIPVIYNSVKGNIGYMFGVWCLLDAVSLKSTLMYPIAFFIFPSVAFNIATLIKIASVAKSRNATVQAILGLQIRSFFFVFTILFIYLFYWLHYEVRISHLEFDTSSQWIKDWAQCILSGKTQDECSEVSKDHVPHMGLYITAEILICSCGIIIFAFFGVKQEIWIFYKELLTGKSVRIFDSAQSYEMPSKDRKNTSHQNVMTSKKDDDDTH